MTPANFVDGSFFSFTVYGKTVFPPNLITKITIIGSGMVNDPYEAVLQINNGHPLKSGRYC